jgi:hypothetical protein
VTYTSEQKLRALAELGIPFEEAERLLRTSRTAPPSLSAAERMRADRVALADDLALRESTTVARTERLRRWLGWDIASPPEDEESE